MGTLVFWHNFGDHAGEKPEAILRRKREEIARNTWTLWSFRHRKDNFVKSWVDVIKGSKQERVFVLCSASKKVFFPKIDDEEKILQLAEAKDAKQYKEYQDHKWQEWQNVPKKIKVPHPWGEKGKYASAFKVSRIIYPSEETNCDCGLNGFKVKFHLSVLHLSCGFKWLDKDGIWQEDRIPTKGEYLLKTGEGTMARPICAILELKAPYVVQIKPD